MYGIFVIFAKIAYMFYIISILPQKRMIYTLCKDTYSIFSANEIMAKYKRKMKPTIFYNVHVIKSI